MFAFINIECVGEFEIWKYFVIFFEMEVCFYVFIKYLLKYYFVLNLFWELNRFFVFMELLI